MALPGGGSELSSKDYTLSAVGTRIGSVVIAYSIIMIKNNERKRPNLGLPHTSNRSSLF